MSVSAYSVLVVFHVLAVIVAVGAVTVVDYLHLVGLRRKKLERQLTKIYPKLSEMVNISLGVIYLTGLSLIWMNSELLSNSLFLLKIILVLVVTFNGIYLQKKVSPNLDMCVLEGTKYCSPGVLYSSAIAGSISIVTWYSIVVLSLTKTFGYSVSQFLTAYGIVLFSVALTAVHFERKARKWRD